MDKNGFKEGINPDFFSHMSNLDLNRILKFLINF